MIVGSAENPPAREERPSRLGPPSAQEKVLLALVAVLVPGSALAIGSVHTVVLVPVAALAVAAALVAVPLRLSPTWSATGVAPRLSPTWPAPGLVLLALALFTALQAVPLPLGLLAKIAPANADVWARSLLPLGEHPSWGSVSLDPGATLVEALKWTTYGCVFLAATTLAMRRGTAFVLSLVFASATLLAIVTLLHGMASATKVFGLYQPSGAFAPNHVGPLLNPNNLAGYLTLGSICGLGLILMRRPLVRRWLVAVGVAVDIGAIVRSGSRGGVAALLIGVVVLAGLAWRTAARSSKLRRRVMPFVLVGGTVAFGGVLAVLGGTGSIWRDLFNDNVAKLKLVVWSAPLLREYAWLGVGRGAFETVFEAYRPAIRMHVIYTHPENFPAQWAAEWGVVVAAAALLSLAWLFRPRAMGVTRSAVTAAGWCAVLALAIQNLADLGLEIPAVGIATAVVLGALWGDPNRRRRRRTDFVHRALALVGLRSFAIGVAGFAGVFGVLALSFGLRDVGMQREALREAFERADDEPGERPSFRAALRSAMAWRPAEHYFSLLGATAAFRWKDQSAMPWVEHALERAPMNGRAHALLASVLAARGARKQALLELRLAVEYEPGLTEKSMPLATALGRTFEELIIAIPEGPPGGVVLSIMARWLQKPEQADLRRMIDAEAIARDPTLVEPRRRLLTDMFATIEGLAAGKDPKGSCATIDACTAAVEAHAAAIDATMPDSSLGATMRAKALIAAGKRDEAEKVLRDGCARPEARTDCLEVRIENLTHLKDAALLDAVLKEYMSDGCTSSLPCASAATFVGDVRERRGEHQAAAMAYMRAAQEDSTEERWIRAADAAEKAKLHIQAIEALQHVLSFREGGNTEITARITRLRAAAQSDSLLKF